MLQQALFTDTPRARRNDPTTSHTAADRIKTSGKLANHQHAIKAAIRSRPGMTYTEIADFTGLERHAVARRLKELEPLHATRGDARNGMTTWWPA